MRNFEGQQYKGRLVTMTSNDEWLKERVRSIQTYHGGSLVHIQDVRAFGQEAIERERERLLDRLRNPDEALIDAVGMALYRADKAGHGILDSAPFAINALALTLSEGQENSDV